MARVRRARARAAEQQANRLPSASGSALAIEARLSSNNPLTGGSDSGGSTAQGSDFYNLGLTASWELDLFGGRKSAAQGAGAEAEAADAELADLHVSLAAQIALAYLDYRNWQHQQALLQASIALLEESLRLEETRVRFGTSSDAGVSAIRGRLAASRAKLASTGGEKTAANDRLALLTGEVPGALDDVLVQVQPLPLPPQAVAVGDPAGLLQRRPDIRAAERRLAAANARIGVANAQRFPAVSFFGVLGIGGSSPGEVFGGDNLTGIMLPRINWSFLDFGRTRARVDQARAEADEAAANYDRSVLAALTDAEQSLARFGAQREHMFQVAEALKEASRSTDLAQARFRRGTASRIDIINANLQKQEVEQSRLMAASDLTKSYVAVQKSLGLGWLPIAKT